MPSAQPASATTSPSIRAAGIPLSPEDMACVRAVRDLGDHLSGTRDKKTSIQLLCACRQPEDMRRLVRYSMKEAWREDQRAKIADPHHPSGAIVRKAKEGWQSTVRRYARAHGLDCKAEVRAVDNNRHGDYDLYFSPKDDPFLKWVAAGGRYGAGETELIALCRKRDADTEMHDSPRQDVAVARENPAPVAQDLAAEEVIAVRQDACVLPQEAALQTMFAQEDAAEPPQEDAQLASVAQESVGYDLMAQPATATETAKPDTPGANGQVEHDLPVHPSVRLAAGSAATAKPQSVKSRRNAALVARPHPATDTTGRAAIPEPAPQSRPRRHPNQRHILHDVPTGMAAFAAPGIAQLPQGYRDRQCLPARPATD